MLSLVPTSLAVSLAAPPVAVEAPDDLVAIRGALVQRFLESGRVLVSSATPGASVVSARALRHSVLVEATCDEHRVSFEVDRTREDLLRLEVVHRALQAVHQVDTIERSDTSSPRSRAALHFVGFEPSSVVYADASSPLLDAGFDVVGPMASADWVVCVWERGDGFVAQRARGAPCSQVPPDGAPVMSPGIASTLADGSKLSDAVEQQARAQAEADAAALVEALLDESHPPALPPPAAPESAPPSEPDSPPTSRGWWVVRGDAGVVLRAGNEVADAAFSATLGAGKGLWGGAARVSLVPYLGGDRLAVLETFVGIGPSVGGWVRPRVGLGAALLGGLLVHSAAWDGAPDPIRLNPQGSLPLTLDVKLRGGLGLHVIAELGVMNRVRSHHNDDALLWRRGAVRIGLSAGLHWRGPSKRRAR